MKVQRKAPAAAGRGRDGHARRVALGHRCSSLVIHCKRPALLLPAGFTGALTTPFPTLQLVSSKISAPCSIHPGESTNDGVLVLQRIFWTGLPRYAEALIVDAQ